MARIKRWFNVSHDLNSDPEVWELTDTFGDWLLRVWLQMLSIGDRNEYRIKGERRWIEVGLSTLWKSNSKRYNQEWRRNRVGMALDWMANKGWIRFESDGILIVNQAKYNITRDTKEIPSGKPKAPPPSFPSFPSQPLSTSPPPPSPQNGWGTPEALVALYNGLKPVEAPTVTRLTPARTKKARTYLAIFPAEDFWRTVLVEAGRSPMLRGLKPSVGHEHFRFSFDWMLTRGKDGTENAIKVAEGRYRDDAQKGPKYRTMAKCPTCAAHHFTDEGCEREAHSETDEF